MIRAVYTMHCCGTKAMSKGQTQTESTIPGKGATNSNTKNIDSKREGISLQLLPTSLLSTIHQA